MPCARRVSIKVYTSLLHALADIMDKFRAGNVQPQADQPNDQASS